LISLDAKKPASKKQDNPKTPALVVQEPVKKLEVQILYENADTNKEKKRDQKDKPENAVNKNNFMTRVENHNDLL